jgi:hypothetical protein
MASSQELEVAEFFSAGSTLPAYVGVTKTVTLTTGSDSKAHLTFVTVAGQAGTYEYLKGPPIVTNPKTHSWSLKRCDVTVVGK